MGSSRSRPATAVPDRADELVEILVVAATPNESSAREVAPILRPALVGLPARRLATLLMAFLVHLLSHHLRVVGAALPYLLDRALGRVLHRLPLRMVCIVL